MCGIAAIFYPQPTQLSQQIVDMTQVVHYRGPDDKGFVFFSNETATTQLTDRAYTGALGHRRLSILDLSSQGHQPMPSMDGRIWLTYNGEIYNYRELRSELEGLGHRFTTSSDTEVLLQAYEEWNEACLEHLNGMFAFVLYDLRRNRVLAARDRFGIKPLYYWRAPSGGLAFASEIKQFTVLPGWRAQMNGQLAYDFLNWGLTDHTSNTLFEGVQQLRGGERLSFGMDDLSFPHRIKPERWYELKPTPFLGGFEEASRTFRSLFEDSLRLHLHADVEVGSCLSGGLDSSAIVCVSQKLRNAQRHQVFHASCEDKAFDERSFVDRVVEVTGAGLHLVQPQVDDLFDSLSELVWHQDEPFGSTSIYAQWLLFRLARQQGIKVMLDGQGSDEILAGYPGFFGLRFFDLFKSLRWGHLYREMKATVSLHQTFQPVARFLGHLVPMFARQSLLRMLGRPATKPDFLDICLLGAEERDPRYVRGHQELDSQCRLQLLQTSLPMLLRFEDRNAMAHSVEARLPFLDHRLVEFALGLPTDFKIAEGWTKRVLRHSLRGVVPEAVRTRVEKMSFDTAERFWLCHQAPDQFKQALEAAIDSSEGILTPQAREHVHQVIEGSRPFSHLPWRIIAFGSWIQRFAVIPAPSRIS